MHRITLLLATYLVLSAVCCQAGDDVPVRDPKRFPADLRALHALRDEFANTSGDQSEASGRRFWEHSGRVARARGPAILHAMMEDARHWYDEEILVYYDLIFQLDRQPTLRILADYERTYPSNKDFFDGLRNEMADYDARMRARRGAH